MNPNRILLRRRDFWRLAAAGQLAALPAGVTPLAYTLLTASILHSDRLGGAMVSAGVAAEVLGGPLAGRLLDRLGIGRGLPALLLVAALGYGLLAILAGHVGVPVLLALAVAPSLPAAAFTGGVRTAMAQTLPDALLSPAVGLTATLLEGTLIVGPLLAAGLAAVAPTAAIGALALAMALSALVMPRPADRPAPPDDARTSLWRDGRVARWLASSAGTAALFGSLEVGALGLAHRLHGGASTAAVLLVLVSGASALSGLAFTAHGHRLRGVALHRAAWLMCVLGLAMAVVALAGSPWIVAPALVAIGLGTAPLLATQSLALQTVLPAARQGEGFTLLACVASGGYAVGSLAVALLPLPVAMLLGAAGPLVVGGALLVISLAPRATTRPAIGACGR